MKPFLHIRCRFGLGLSDTTYQGMSSDHIIGQQPKYPKSTRPPYNAEHSEVRHNRHAIKTCQEGEKLHRTENDFRAANKRFAQAGVKSPQQAETPVAVEELPPSK